MSAATVSQCSSVDSFYPRACADRNCSATPQDTVLEETKQEFTENATPQASERLAAVSTILDCNPKSNPTIRSILLVLKSLLKVDTACCNLITKDAVCIKQSRGSIPEACSFSAPAFCFWTLVPEEPQTLIVEDTLLDARTSTSSIVTGEPYIRFYTAAPLVTGNKQRVGTLCAVHSKPMRFGRVRAALLNNFAELVMRVLEGAVLQKHPTSPILDGYHCRGSAAYEQAYAIIDTSAPKWKILHANPAFNHLGGKTSAGEGVEKGFWDLFTCPNNCWSKSLESGESSGSQAPDWEQPEVIDNIRSTAFEGLLQAVMRPATASRIDSDALVVGNPSRRHNVENPTPDATSEFGSLYIVLLKAGKQQRRAKVLPFNNLKMGTALGAGRYAKVFRGALEGEKIAVKIVHCLDDSLDRGGNPMEALSMQATNHPNVLKLLDYKMVPGAAQRLWLLLEYCERGNLGDAIDKGWFREAPRQTAGPCFRTILTTAREMASGFCHIHARGIIHSDVSGGNILLQGNPANPHGFSAKIADFGLARWESDQQLREVSGTPAYLAPEVLRGDLATQASDIYSIGVLLYEMVTGKKAWAGLNAFQIFYVTVEAAVERLEVPEGVPLVLTNIIDACMARDPGRRPTASDLLRQIEAALKSL